MLRAVDTRYALRVAFESMDIGFAALEKSGTTLPDAVFARWGEPEDVGSAAALCCGDFPYMTGESLPVDGGLHIPSYEDPW